MKYLKMPKQENPILRAFTQETHLLVLERSINALGRNFSEIEGKFDSHVDAITNKQEMDQKLDQISRIIDSYKEEYYALLKRSNKDSADATLLSKLEDMIIKFKI